ncbi:MAG TPA: RagB/SusD family nutrient uptake outer membrane protein, partial [Longimicrobium sp.]|nr:RagB/SusD family nutrient uptake outer membrane protein [Longimicrobium sp.]
MNNRTRALALLAVAALGTAGCKDDFLTEVPYSFVSPENLFTSSDGALAALSGTYAAFQARVPELGVSDVDYYGRQYWMLVEYPTEVVTLRLGATNERTEPDIFRVRPTHNYIIGVWRAAFHAVNRANSVIDNVPGIASMDAGLRDRVVAEARFLRAYHYFNLVRLFGGVPLYLTETRSLEDIQKPRATQAEVYAAIIADLTDAAGVLPVRYTGRDVGRATSGAAKALLAKVYLQYGAVGGGGAAAFTQAESWARQAMAGGGGYSLLPSYASVFDQANENNAEVIFAVQNQRVAGMGGRLAQHVAPIGSNLSGANTAGVSFYAEWPFFRDWSDTDKRKAGTFLTAYTHHTRGPLTWSRTMTSTQQTAYGTPGGGPSPRKYLDPLAGTGGA